MKPILLTFLALFSTATFFAQAINDECVDRITITVATASANTYSIDTATATESMDASCENAGNDNLDVWYEFTMPVNGNVHITGIPNTVSRTLFDSCGGSELVCGFDDGFFFNLSAGTTYVLRISERSLFAGGVNFNIQAFETATNNECANSTPIAVTTGGASNYNVDFRAATESMDTSCENASNTNLDVWFEFTMPFNGNVLITGIPNTVSRTLFDSCGGTELACGFDDGFFYGLTSGTTYVLRFAERVLFAGTINFDIEAFEVASNDECIDRTLISVPTGGANTYSIDTRTASESLDASCENASNVNLDLWFEFVMPVNGNVRITGIPNTLNKTLYDSCGGSELICSFNDGFFNNLTSGTTYVLRLAERSMFAGTVNFDIEAFETAPNDDCVGRIPLVIATGGANSYSFDFRSATESVDASCENAGNANLDVWYEFTMPVDGNIHITGIPNTVTRTLYDACGGTELACGVNDGFFYSLTSGVTYVLRLGENSIFAGPITFDIEAFEAEANDECVDASTLIPGVVAPVTIDFDSRGYTESLDASCDGTTFENLDGWYLFEMPFDGDIQITGANNQTSISFFDACGGTELDCFSGSSTAFGFTGGVSYYMRVSRSELFPGIDSFDVQALPAPLPTCGVTTEWIAGSWNNGAPDITKNVVIRSAYNTATHGSFSACSLAIDSGITLTVGASDHVEVAYNVNVAGTLDLQHEGSLLQRDDASVTVNNGTIRVRKTTPFLKPRDFMIMGSPMDAETREGVYNSAFIVLAHDTNNFVPNPDVATAFPSAENFADDNGDNWSPHTGLVNVGEGYLVRPQASYTDGNTTYDLLYDQGTLNNGVVTVPLVFNSTQNDSPNVLGNPYASAISANDFINANPEIDALYFWEHLTPPSPSLPGAYAMNFSMEDISMYNLMGGVAAASDPSGSDTAPNGYIASAQGFGVKALASGTAIFNNSMRRLGNNDTWRTASEEKTRLWLSVHNAEFELQNTTLIGFTSEASEGLDPGYDTKRLATVVSLYSLTENNEELGIQSREAFHTGIKVSLGFSSLVATDTEYTISINEWEGSALEDVEVFLYDSLTEELTELTTNSYTFRSNKGDYPNRFSLFFREPSLSTSENGLDTLQWFPNPSEGKITLWNPSGIALEKLSVFNMLGQEIKTIPLQKLGTQTIDLGALQQGMYFLHWHTEEGMQTDQLILK